jgi:hypothetical protein
VHRLDGDLLDEPVVEPRPVLVAVRPQPVQVAAGGCDRRGALLVRRRAAPEDAELDVRLAVGLAAPDGPTE